MLQVYSNVFSNKPRVESSSPGRINLIGEHTDYNDGFVLPGAIDKDVRFLLGKNGKGDHCRVFAVDMDEMLEFSLSSLKREEQGGWKNYIIGVVAELIKAGASLEGFDAVFQGDVPLGAGLSSSAALECSLATGLNKLFDLGFSKTAIAFIAQAAEHNYAGVKCGIMDQFASVMGEKGKVFMLDCRSMDYKHFSLPLKTYELLLLNTCVEHSLAGSAYNERRLQCEEGASIIRKKNASVKNLRDVDPEMLEGFKESMDPLVYQRCEHVVRENVRVQRCCEAIDKGDITAVGQLLYQSHYSLSRQYEVSCPELDFLVDFTRALPNVPGARMMGGGFGGCTINLIKSEGKEAFVEAISKAYSEKWGIDLKVYSVSLQDGAQAVNLT